jgi:Na+/citrate or Na+/malate symporter
VFEMPQLSQWVNSLPISIWMRQIIWMVPLLQVLHILSIAAILSSIIMIDLRIFGVSRSHTLAEQGRRFLPWMWVAVVISAVTGVALMLGSPRSFRDVVFVTKLWLMAGATVTTIALPFVLRWNGGSGQKDARAVTALVGVAALALWLGATLAGRGRWMAGFLAGL